MTEPSNALATTTTPEAEPDHPILHVVFRVDGAEYALPASAVQQLETYAGATPVPGALAYVAGIVQLRGVVVPVVDLRRRFGLEPKAPTLETRVVVVDVRERTVALVADSAREVVRIAPSQAKPPPRLVEGDGNASVVRAVAQLGPRTLMILDLEALIGEEISRVER